MSENTELRKAIYAYRALPTEANKKTMEDAIAEYEEKFGRITTAFIVKESNLKVDENNRNLLKKHIG
jgi:hypothetical protein